MEHVFVATEDPSSLDSNIRRVRKVIEERGRGRKKRRGEGREEGEEEGEEEGKSWMEHSLFLQKILLHLILTSAGFAR